MTRPKLRAGELGRIQIVTLPSGRIQARALMVDELEKLRRVKASGDTEDEAIRALRTNADLIRSDTGGPTLRSDATIAEACAVFRSRPSGASCRDGLVAGASARPVPV